MAQTLFDPAPAAPRGPLVRVKLLVAYDGTRFHGFAPQPGVRTVGGVLAAALARVLGHEVDITCAGRTDRGVHGWGQVVSFDASASRVEPDALARSLRHLLGPEVVVREAAVVGPDFDARFSARSRTYRYRVLHAPVADPLRRHVTWHVPHRLEPRLLDLACDPFLGEHDFSAFCRRPKVPAGRPEPSLVRRVLRAGWTEVGDERWFEIEATAFCHQMVRSIVGACVAAGRGRIHAGDITAILRGRDRSAAPPPAPPHGLCLWSVQYG